MRDKINEFSGIFFLVERNIKRSKELVCLKKGREKGGRERKRQMTKVKKDMARLRATTLTK